MPSTLLRRFTLNGLTASCVAILAGCAVVGPDYEAPEMKMATTWQAAMPHDGSTQSLLNWWADFNDPVLTALLQAAEAHSPSLAQAAAVIDAARAARARTWAADSPSVNARAASNRKGSLRSQDGENSTINAAGFDASWEIDLFGAVRRNQDAASARLEASEADWHTARVSVAAEVATEYASYRACRLLSENYRNNLDSLKKTADTTSVAVERGVAAPVDEILAQASVANASASLNSQEMECELRVKALVALTEIAEPELRAMLDTSEAGIPNPKTFNITTLPVQLLSQRPDLVAVERSLAAANAEIGVAEANRYPRLSLLGSISIGRTESLGTSIDSSPWSFGPSLSLPLFDGGNLRAQADVARANYAAVLARYQAAVRTAVKEVEQSLVRLDAANRRTTDLINGARDYRRYFDAAEHGWRAGSISLLTLEEARRNALQTEQNSILAQRDKVLYGIALYKALGGGWQTDQAAIPNMVSQ